MSHSRGFRFPYMNAQSLGRILFFIVFAILLASIIIYFARPGYPIRRVIKNTEGVPVDVVIIGKITDTIYFTRMPDRKNFELTLDKLAFRDRVLLTFLKDQAPPATTPDRFSDNYVKNRLQKIEQLKKKEKIMVYELESATLNPIMEKDYQRRIDVIRKDIRTLEVAIETYRYRLKKK